MKFFKVRAWRKKLGDAGERATARFFRAKGMTLLVHNCRTPKAELDLVARDGAVLVFAEVKSMLRRSGHTRMGVRPSDRLSDTQKQRIVRGAYSYLNDLNEMEGIRFRFDLVEVIFEGREPAEIRHHPAFFGQIARNGLDRHTRFARNPVSTRVFRRRKDYSI